MTDTPEHIDHTDVEYPIEQPTDDMEGMSAYAEYSDQNESLAPLSEEPPQRVTLTRIERLTLAIERDPTQPSNYVYRGEAYLEKRQDELAVEDFQTAIGLAETQAESANWGYIYTALIDRAREHLRRIQS